MRLLRICDVLIGSRSASWYTNITRRAKVQSIFCCNLISEVHELNRLWKSLLLLLPSSASSRAHLTRVNQVLSLLGRDFRVAKAINWACRAIRYDRRVAHACSHRILYTSKSNLIGAHRGARAERSLSEMATFDCSFHLLNRTIHVLDPDHVVILRDSLRQTFGRLVLGELEQAMFPG